MKPDDTDHFSGKQRTLLLFLVKSWSTDHSHIQFPWSSTEVRNTTYPWTSHCSKSSLRINHNSISGVQESKYQLHQELAMTKLACNRDTIKDSQHPVRPIYWGYSKIRRHFPFASGCIVFSEVWCSFLVRAYELLHKYLLAQHDYAIVVPVLT